MDGTTNGRDVKVLVGAWVFLGALAAGLMLAVLAASLVFMLWRIRSMNDPPAS